MKTAHTTPEILEARIAPAAAIFFVSPADTGGDALNVFKGAELAGTSTDEQAAKTAMQSDAAVLLGKGDRLVFDTNNNRELDADDVLLMKVTSGKAMVFLTDIMAGATADAFDQNEITGLAVSDKFKGEVYTDINGSVVTALSSTGALTSGNPGEVRLQHHSIAGLKVSGQIYGAVAAGGAISNLTVGAPAFISSSSLSVHTGIYTGSAANLVTVTLNAFATFGLLIEPNPGENGGNISNVTLAAGTRAIHAGDGGEVEKGKAGVGGSISNVTILDSDFGISIEAGRGGLNMKGTGGAGGSVSKINLALEPLTNSEIVTIKAGNGGGAGTGNGGKGGSVQTLTINVPLSMNDMLIAAGVGGTSEDKGNGGTGGGVFDLNITGASMNTFQIDGGAGGGAYIGNGGAGGGLGKIEVSVDNLSGLGVNSGSGGSTSSGKGGAAGGMKTITADVETASNGIYINSGSGGSGTTGGGAGGGILDAHFDSGTLADAVHIYAGDGGTALGMAGSGGAGGSISKLTLSVNDVNEDVFIIGGDGGGSVVKKAGVGGALTGVNVEVAGDVVGTVEVFGGVGGHILEGEGLKSRAANGGAIKDMTLQNDGTIEKVIIESGLGGVVQFGKGVGGDGGALDKINYTGDGQVDEIVFIVSGIGGGPAFGSSGGPLPISLALGNGGNSGNISNVTIEDGAALTNHFEVYAGYPEDIFSGSGKGSDISGMNGLGTDAKGGSVGSVKNVTLTASQATVVLGNPAAAGFAGSVLGGMGPVGPTVSDKSIAGNGGDISNVNGEAGIFSIYAPGGGASFGKAGRGGNVFDVEVTANTYAHVIAAGNGGDGFVGGAGGSIKDVSIEGDIGNFTAEFGFDLTSPSMGGLVAGKGGGFMEENLPLNGSIQNVSATRIASILAGIPMNVSELGYNNAVNKISGVTANTIGADVDGDTVFDFTEGSGGAPSFQPDADGNDTTADIAIDGFVLVRTGGIVGALPVAPFKLIEVELEPEYTIVI